MKTSASQKKTSKRSTNLQEEEKRINLELKKLEAAEKKAQIEDWEKRKLDDNEAKTLIEKIETLRRLLESVQVDEEKTIIGSENRLKNVFTEEETWCIKNKLFQLMAKM
ncbi:MAG: hypothetical protein N2167_00505 [Flavobacteriales bacterium]|nr:hypothetical protein [Flavobacteriales bacterium]